MRKVSIIGPGRAGGALALALARRQYFIDSLFYHRTAANADKIASLIKPQPIIEPFRKFKKNLSDIIFIAVPDDKLAAVASTAASGIHSGASVFHLSGSRSSDELATLREIGCAVGSMHPLVSISDPVSGADSFAGAYFCVEGDKAAVELAEKIVDDLGASSFSIDGKFKPLYHAAAVTACGHLVTLIDVAAEILGKCGIEPNDAKQYLLPLIKTTLANLERQDAADALTGTFARADLVTFLRHLASLEENVSPQLLEIYLLLGEKSLEIAERRGADSADLEKLRQNMHMAKSKLR